VGGSPRICYVGTNPSIALLYHGADIEDFDRRLPWIFTLSIKEKLARDGWDFSLSVIIRLRREYRFGPCKGLDGIVGWLTTRYSLNGALSTRV